MSEGSSVLSDLESRLESALESMEESVSPTMSTDFAEIGALNGEALGYLVLTSADEVICAYGCYYRAMIGLKEDGSFSFSSSAAESGVATFSKDENRDAQYKLLAES